MPGGIGPSGVYRNPTRWKAVVHQQEIRHSTAGCLLSVVLFAPLFVRAYGLGRVAAVVAVYGVAVVPALAGYYSLPALLTRALRLCVRCCRRDEASTTLPDERSSLQQGLLLRLYTAVTSIFIGLVSLILDLFSRMGGAITGLKESLQLALLIVFFPLYCLPCCLCFCLAPALHQTFTKCRSLRVTVNQLLFSVLLERLLMGEVRLLALYSVLACNVLLYIRRSIMWSPLHMLPGAAAPNYFACTGLFMAAKLGKAAVLSVVLSISACHLLRGDNEDNGILSADNNQYNRDRNVILVFTIYNSIAMLYFGLTQHVWTGDETAIQHLKRYQFAVFEDEEEFWLPFILNSIPVLSSVLLISVITFPSLISFIISIILLFSTIFQSNKEEFMKGTLKVSDMKEYSHSNDEFNYDSSQYLLTNVKNIIFSLYSRISSFIWPSTLSNYPQIKGLYSEHKATFKTTELRNIFEINARLGIVSSVLQGTLLLITVYSCVFVPGLLLLEDYKHHDRKTGEVMRRFRKATKEECARVQTCAVCLDVLVSARATECGHLYHASCLRALLRSEATRCPLCNSAL